MHPALFSPQAIILALLFIRLFRDWWPYSCGVVLDRFYHWLASTSKCIQHCLPPKGNYPCALVQHRSEHSEMQLWTVIVLVQLVIHTRLKCYSHNQRIWFTPSLPLIIWQPGRGICQWYQTFLDVWEASGQYACRMTTTLRPGIISIIIIIIIIIVIIIIIIVIINIIIISISLRVGSVSIWGEPFPTSH